jgi:hypothetical protein
MKLLVTYIFSTSLLPRPSQAQISSPTPYARKPSAYVSLSMCTNTKQKAKLQITSQKLIGTLKFYGIIRDIH